MHCPVREIQSRIGADEFTEWCAYFHIDPWGEERADLRNALLCRLVSGMFGNKSDVYDFMPFTERPPQDPAAGMALLKAAIQGVQ